MKSLYAQLNQIVTIRTFDKKESHDRYKYIDEVREERIYAKWYHRLILKKTTVKTHYKGYYADWYGSGFSEYSILVSAERLRELDLIVDDELHKVYNKPYLHISFVNKDSFEKRFETHAEIEAFLKPLVYAHANLYKIIS